MKNMTRRTALKSTLGAGFALATASCTDKKACASKEPPALKKEDFYTDGAFDKNKALQAYYDMMNRFGYPIYDMLKTDNLWTCDFVQNDFLKLGMAGIFWINKGGTYGEAGAKAYQGEYKDKNYGYLGHEIFLLPGQMLPEHGHLGGDKGFGPKMEAWQVRHGSVEFFGQYATKGGNEKLISEMPEADRPWGYGEDWFKSKYVKEVTAKSGVPYVMDDAESWHFQRAGKYGAIVTEFATFHNHVQFSKPDMKFANTGDKA